MACVGKKQPAGEDGTVMRGVVTRPVNLDSDSPPLDYPGIRFDDQGIIVPHSILGSLEEFRKFLEDKGETELLKRILKSQRSPASDTASSNHTEVVKKEVLSDHRNIQSNALQHWQTHMGQRRRQQDFLSDKLNRPVDSLLMNQDKHFRETQEQKEFLSRAMPLIHSGYGYRVGSEFWSLPQHYGDEISGITATLTQTEQGRREPVTHVGQPQSIRQESGIICGESLPPACLSWNRSSYLQQCQELREVLKDMDVKKPDISGLEVIGSAKPFAFVTVRHSPLLEKEKEEHREMKMENLDPQSGDAVSDALRIPALRFCGQLAKWTGHSTSNQKEVGIGATVIFNAMTGEIASSDLELHNEGSTAIFYSWQQIHVPSHFPKLLHQSRRKRQHFYFNSSPGVILPGATHHVELTFKSELAGIKTEIWQLNTHPVLLRGASMQVMLKGMALFQDKTADQRLFIETKLEKTVTKKMCGSIVYELLQGVHTPERPSSPAELYITEEAEFVRKNPKLQYFNEAVGKLKRLWRDVNPGDTWDLSVDTLQQAVRSLPLEESTQSTITREKGLSQLNFLLLQLSEPAGRKHCNLTAEIIGQQLWKKLLDTMADEAVRLRYLLGLPVKETWADKKDESLISDSDLAENMSKDEKSDEKGGTAAEEGRSEAKSRLKDHKKGEPKTAATEKAVEKRKKKGDKKDEVGKGKAKEKQGRELVLATETLPERSRQQPLEVVERTITNTYKKFLHKKVYALMGDLVDTFCDLMDDGHEQDILLKC